jgi:dCMP deaminase
MNNLLPIPTWDEFFMRHTYLVATKSKDLKTKIGAVLVRDQHVISEGYNGICRKVVDTVPTRLERPEKYLWFEHAERNSVFTCARHGISTLGSVMFTQGIPCSDCARAVIQAGVVEVVVHQQWEDRSGLKENPKWTQSCATSVEMFNEAGVKLRYFDMELGTQGQCDGKVFNV